MDYEVTRADIKILKQIHKMCIRDRYVRTGRLAGLISDLVAGTYVRSD